VPKRPSVLKVSDDTIKRMAKVFKLLADESRMKILIALAQDGEMHVSALCALLGQSQPAVSHHLTLMRLTGLVSYRRDGKNNFYRLEHGHLRDLLEQVFDDCGNASKLIQFDDFALAYKRSR
jgi:ArsR family transcriptional regulator